MFDKILFSSLLQKACGDLTQTDFAVRAEIDRTYISKYINQKLDSPPSPDIIKRIADVSYNGVTYESLMEAAGHIIKSDNDINIIPNPDIRAIARAGENMSTQDALELRKLAERLYPDAFKKHSN